MRALWIFLTDFGDTAVTVPLAVLMAGFLALVKERWLAFAWCLAIGACAGAMGLLKLAFSACGAPVIGPVLSSPSGHTAMGIAVYGGYAAVLGTQLPLLARVPLIVGATIFAVGIGLSRVVLHNHSPVEVAVGMTVGATTMTALLWIVTQRPPARLPIGKLVAAATVVALLLHGERWPAEQAIRRLAGWFDLLRPWCS